MKELGCSFPWLKSYNGTLKKCGNDHYVKDLAKLVNDVYNSSDEIDKKLEELGCNIPNCENVNWSQNSAEAEVIYDKDFTQINLNFPSSSKVKSQKITGKFKSFFNLFLGPNYSRIFCLY